MQQTGLIPKKEAAYNLAIFLAGLWMSSEGETSPPEAPQESVKAEAG